MSYDNSNIETANFVLQNADAAGERGVPAPGKLVFRTDSLAAEICVDTDPDPLENDGGTWTSLGGPTDLTGIFDPDVTQGGGNIGVWGGACLRTGSVAAGAVVEFRGRFLIGSSGTSGEIRMTPIPGLVGSGDPIGEGYYIDADGDTYTFVIHEDSADMVFRLTDGSLLGGGFTAASGDSLHVRGTLITFSDIP